MSPQGAITPLGQQYIGAVKPNVTSDYQPGVVHGGSGVSAPTQVPNSSNRLRGALLEWVTLSTLASLCFFSW